MINNVMILAAGFGSRLKPLTTKIPKPLIPIFNGRLIDFPLSLCKELPVIANKWINTHYSSSQLQAYISKNDPKFHTLYEPTILGTGGAIRAIADALLANTAIVMNSDIICDFNLKQLEEEHTSSGYKASMVLTKVSKNTGNPVFVNPSDSTIRSIGGAPLPDEEEYTFTGIHLLSPDFKAWLRPTEYSCIIESYQDMLAKKEPIGAIVRTSNYWRDLGTPQSYWQFHLDLLTNVNGLKDRFLPLLPALFDNCLISLNGTQIDHENGPATYAGQNLVIRHGTVTTHPRSQLANTFVYATDYLGQADYTNSFVYAGQKQFLRC